MKNIHVSNIKHSGAPSILIEQEYASVKMDNVTFSGIHTETASSTIGFVTGKKLLIINSHF